MLSPMGKGTRVGRMSWVVGVLALLLCVVRGQVPSFDPGSSSNANCAGNMDLLLVLDSSGSIGLEYEDVRTFALDAVEYFDPSESGIHIGVVQFAGQGAARVEMRLTGNKDNLLKAINTMNQIYGLTSITEGLQYGYDELNLHRRAGTNAIIMFMTDGQNTNATDQSTIEMSDLIKESHMQLFGIGVTDATNHDFNMKLVTSPADQHYWKAANFTQLVEMGDWMVAVCLSVLHLAPFRGPTTGSTLIEIEGSGFSDFNQVESRTPMSAKEARALVPKDDQPTQGEMLLCRFADPDLKWVRVVKAFYTSPTLVMCRAPSQAPTKIVYVETSLDGGFSYTDNRQRFVYYTYYFWWWAPLPLLIVMLALICYWLVMPFPICMFWPLKGPCPGMSRPLGPPPRMPMPPPQYQGEGPMGSGPGVVGEAGKKKWDKLSPTEYLWTSGGGGIMKMNVDWGTKGDIVDEDYTPMEDWEPGMTAGSGKPSAFKRKYFPSWCPSWCP